MMAPRLLASLVDITLPPDCSHRRARVAGHAVAALRRFQILAILLVSALVLLCVLSASAGAVVSTGDGSWVWQNQRPQGNGGNGVSAHGWVVGNGGMILATSTGGWPLPR